MSALHPLAPLALAPLIAIGFACFATAFVGLMKFAEAAFESDARRAALGAYILVASSFLFAVVLVAIRALTGGAS